MIGVDLIRKDSRNWETPSNRNIPGSAHSTRYLKPEYSGTRMTRVKEFVGLRSKLYSLKMEEGKETKKCKGVKRQVVENYITHEDYKTCLITGKEKLARHNIIRSYDHEVYTEEVNKIALSAEDDKRYLLKDSFDTLAWGHYKIKDM